MTTIDITDIQRLEVRPNQALIVRVPGNTSQVEHARVIEAFRHALPETPVFVVRDDIEFSVIEQNKSAVRVWEHMTPDYSYSTDSGLRTPEKTFNMETPT